MNSKMSATLLCAACGLTACNTMPTRQPPELTHVSVVIDQLKDELNAFIATDPTVQPNLGACYDGKKPMNLVPLNATVTLKAVVGSENDPTFGLIAPIGGVALDPSYSGAYSTSQTQTIVIPLSIPDSSKAQKPIAPGAHPLGSALAKFRDEILKIDHDKTPCLQYKSGDKANFKLSVVFDAVRKSTGGIALQLVVFKIGDKQTKTSESHQILDIELGLTPGGDVLLEDIQPAGRIPKIFESLPVERPKR
jgi:hypothetical protein